MTKTDFKKELKEFYGGKVAENVIVTVPQMQYLLIDGKGNPNTSPEF